MKTLKYLFFLTLFALSACNGSSSSAPSAPDPEIAVLKTQVQGLTKALAAATHEDAVKFSGLQLIGKLKSVSDIKMQGEFRNEAIANGTNFGPCPDMGLFQGRGGSDTANPLRSQFEVYKTYGCSGNSSGTFTSYNDVTGLHDVPPFIAWDGPNCSGNLYIETDVPQNTFPGAVLSGGIVFTNPVDGLAYWVKGGQIPQPIIIQSALNTSPSGGCSPDNETRMAVMGIRNDVIQSGIPDSLVPGSWALVAP